MTDLESLPTTEAGTIEKDTAMRWLDARDEPSPEELKSVVVPKPSDFSGSKYATEVSGVRLTGTAEFIETAAGLLTSFLDFEDGDTRLEISLQQTEDRETGELTDNYALYLSVAERG